MRRLLRKNDRNQANVQDPSDFNHVQETLNPSDRVDVGRALNMIETVRYDMDRLIDAYRSLFNDMNSLTQAYPVLYDQIKRYVRFPNKRTVQDVSEMRDDFNVLVERYRNEDYLVSVLNPYDGQEGVNPNDV